VAVAVVEVNLVLELQVVELVVVELVVALVLQDHQRLLMELLTQVAAAVVVEET
jgi:hypothetical protein